MKRSFTKFVFFIVFVEARCHIVGLAAGRSQFTTNVEVELIVFEAADLVAIVFTQWTEIECDVVKGLGYFAIFPNGFLLNSRRRKQLFEILLEFLDSFICVFNLADARRIRMFKCNLFRSMNCSIYIYEYILLSSG